jgi:hypothetical protein
MKITAGPVQPIITNGCTYKMERYSKSVMLIVYHPFVDILNVTYKNMNDTGRLSHTILAHVAITSVGKSVYVLKKIKMKPTKEQIIFGDVKLREKIKQFKSEL